MADKITKNKVTKTAPTERSAENAPDSASAKKCGIPRSKVQRQQLNDVFIAKTPITGVGCLESRSDDVVRRTEPLYNWHMQIK